MNDFKPPDVPLCIELQPCPFCGHAAEVERHEDLPGPAYYSISCGNSGWEHDDIDEDGEYDHGSEHAPGCAVSPSLSDVTDLQKAVEYWNRRPGNSAAFEVQVERAKTTRDRIRIQERRKAFLKAAKMLEEMAPTEEEAEEC